jgi:thiamine kinase-like enzyme
VRYSPKKTPDNARLAGCYHLGVRDSDSEYERSVILYFKAFRNGRSQREFDAITESSAGMQSRPGMPLHFSDLDLLVWIFPHDPALPHLPEVSHPERVTAHLPYSSFPQGLDGAGDVKAVEVQVVNYRPELRCTTRYDIRWEAADRPQHLTIFGKTFRSGEGSAILARSEYLWKRFCGVDEDVLFAKPLGYAPSVHTVWQLGIQGSPLCGVIGGGNCHSYLTTVAKGLAMVHNSDLGGLPKSSFDEHLSEVAKKVEKLCRAFPSVADSLDLLMRRIRRNLPNDADIPLRPMYWDFHVNQLLAQDGKVAFFDFDELAEGDPLQDLANFIVDLHFRDVSPFLAQRMAKSLCESYRSQVKWDVPIERIRWHATIQFINKAYRSYNQQWSDVEETVKGIIHMATQETAMDWISKKSG